MKRFNVLLIIVAMSLSMLACSSGHNGDQGPTGPQGVPAPTPTPVDSNTADVLDVLNNGAHGNAYRLGLGQTELSQGLSCQVIHVASGQWLSSSSPGYQSSQGTLVTIGTNYTYLYDGNFDQPNAANGTNDLIPAALQSLFVNDNYRIICTGYIVVQEPGWYEFEDMSDDGSIISTDAGTLYNDGNHAINTVPVTQSMYLDRDVHSFTVQYAQSGGGNFGLILTVNKSAIPAINMYH